MIQFPLSFWDFGPDLLIACANYHFCMNYYFKNNLHCLEIKRETNLHFRAQFQILSKLAKNMHTFTQQSIFTWPLKPDPFIHGFNSWINAEAESSENAERRTAADFTDSLRLFIQFLGKKPRKTVWPPLKAQKKGSDLLWIISVVLPCTPLCISFPITYSNGEQKANINK